MPAGRPRFVTLDRWSDAGHPSNEDAVGATAWAAWAIDGTKGPYDHRLTPGPTDAAWYARALDRALAAAFAGPPGDPALALAEVAERLSGSYAGCAVAAPAHEQPSACLALAAGDAAGRLHLLNIGDCRVLIENAGAVRAFGSSGIARLERAAIVELGRWRQATDDADAVRRQLRGLLRHNFETAMNQPGGYWVTHPSLPWLHAVQHAEVPAGDATHLLLASDGFHRLVDVFHAYDEAGLVAAALGGGGLAALGAELRCREGGDPSCRDHPRLRAMDDASAILIRLEPA